MCFRKYPSTVSSSLTYHLRNSYYIVVATTDETNQCFPSILLQYSHTCEFRRFSLEIRICHRPLLVQLRQVRAKIEVVMHQCFCVIVFERRYCHSLWRRGRRRQWSLGLFGEDSFVVQMRRILTQGKYASMKGTRPDLVFRLPPSKSTINNGEEQDTGRRT